MATNTDEKTFNKWLEKTGRGMTLVTAGQSGVGKSTLVTNLLRKRENVPIAGHKPKPVTKIVEAFNSCINGVDVTIVDMPGLAAASDDEEKKIIAELTKVTGESADMLLYCANMGPSGKISELDRKIVKLLTSVFKPKIWERAILVLTFGDIVKKRNQEDGTTTRTPTVEASMISYAEAFEEMLSDSTTQIKVIPVLKDEGANLRPAKEIAAVVSSEKPNKEVLPGIKWDMCLYEEVLKKCECGAIPSILKIILDPIPDYIQKEAEEGAKCGKIRGAVAGAAAGAGIGLAAGGVGALPGVIGGAIGGVVTGIIGAGVGEVAGRKYFREIAYKRYLESEEGKRAQLLKDIEELRNKDETTKGKESKKDK